MALNEGCSTMSMSGRSNLPPIEGLTEQDRRSIHPGPYHPSEVCVHAFDKWFVATLGTRLTELAG